MRSLGAPSSKHPLSGDTPLMSGSPSLSYSRFSGSLRSPDLPSDENTPISDQQFPVGFAGAPSPLPGESTKAARGNPGRERLGSGSEAGLRAACLPSASHGAHSQWRPAGSPSLPPPNSRQQAGGRLALGQHPSSGEGGASPSAENPRAPGGLCPRTHLG